LLEKGLKNENLIDHQHQKVRDREIQKLKNIFERIIEIILYLTSRNLASRGHSDKLYQSHSGNFLGLIELLAKFDSVLNEHINNFLNKNNTKLLLNHTF